MRSRSNKAALVGAVVEIVRTAIPGEVLERFTGAAEPKLNVGGFWAPAGLDVTAAVRATLPVKPPLGVNVIVEVFAEVAPGLTVTDVAFSVKLRAVTVSVSVFEVLREKEADAW